jgi:DNA repair protein RadC
MFFHNHPSGHVEPSMNDYSTTNKLASGAKIFEIDVLDHIIVSQNDFYSFAAHDDIDPG